MLTGGKKSGTYLEIGGGEPVTDNSTYLLEKEFGWRGVTIEFDSSLVAKWAECRKNPCLKADATTLDYDQILTAHGLGPDIDFLQIDVDGKNTALNSHSFEALQRIDFKKYFFGFVTFEHNLYLNADNPERQRSREILLDHGYTMLISDVKHNNLVFEDWYVLERLMPTDDWHELLGDQIQMNGSLPHRMQTIINKYA